MKTTKSSYPLNRHSSEISTLTVQSSESNKFVKVSDPVEAEDLKRCHPSDYFEDFAELGLGPVRLRNFVWIRESERSPNQKKVSSCNQVPIEDGAAEVVRITTHGRTRPEGTSFSEGFDEHAEDFVGQRPRRGYHCSVKTVRW